jgi:nicotinamide-nucleotide amidase
MAPSDKELERLARIVGELLSARGLTVTTAESCTGGWVAKVLTDVSGSSAWFGWGAVTYADAAKAGMLGVPGDLLAEHGAVSEPVVRAMAAGARRKSGADLALAVSGVAGPDGGTADKPVGTVWFAWTGAQSTRSERCQLVGDRETIRRLAVGHALEGLLNLLAADA